MSPLAAILKVSRIAFGRSWMIKRSTPFFFAALFGAFCDHFEQRYGIFASRILIGEHDDVAEFCGNFALQRPLCQIALSSRTEEGEKPSRTSFSDRRKYRFERRRRVRVIDDEFKGLSPVDNRHASFDGSE